MAGAQFVNKPEYFTLIWREQVLITSRVLAYIGLVKILNVKVL